MQFAQHEDFGVYPRQQVGNSQSLDQDIRPLIHGVKDVHRSTVHEISPTMCRSKIWSC